VTRHTGGVPSRQRSEPKDRFQLKHPVVVGVAIAVAVGALLAGFPIFNTAVTALAVYLILRAGIAMLGGMARPIPEPPPAGELRKVKITYRCSICGTEARMTVSPTEEPEPPRHCTEDMDLVAPIE
jgi:hypothetical protein